MKQPIEVLNQKECNNECRSHVSRTRAEVPAPAKYLVIRGEGREEREGGSQGEGAGGKEEEAAKTRASGREGGGKERADSEVDRVGAGECVIA